MPSDREPNLKSARRALAVLALATVTALLAVPGLAHAGTAQSASARPSYLSPMEWAVLQNIFYTADYASLH